MRLDRARGALQRAERLLNALPDAEGDVTAFRDAVPYVVAQLDLVTDLIDEDSKGQRTKPFSDW